jgi:GTPase SAR1 family protein
MLLYLGALIVYDITDRDSYDKVRNWVKELRINLPSDTPILIAGNKCDVDNRQIPLDEAEE